MTLARIKPSLIALLISSVAIFLMSPAAFAQQMWIAEAVSALEEELVAEHGAEQRARAKQGLDQVASFWREQDGGQVEFEAFVRRHFAGDEESVNVMFGRFE